MWVTRSERTRRVAGEPVTDSTSRSSLAETAIEAAERQHTSLPGLGIILGAELLAATAGDMTAFGTPDRLAGFGGVAPGAP